MPTLDPHSKSCEGLNLSLYCLLSDQEKIKKNLKKLLTNEERYDRIIKLSERNGLKGLRILTLHLVN